MAISGGIKFFDKNLALEKDGATITATSGNDAADKMIDVNRETKWQSVGSNDVTTDTITLTFSASTTIDRILLTGMNLKDFDIMYDVASVWTHFSSVVGLDGSKANITETTFADTSAYYEFASVSTTGIRIRATKTLVVDDEKEIISLIATTELGTFTGFPVVRDITSNRNKRIKKTLSGKIVMVPSFESMSMTVDFRQYPVVSDMTLIGTLHDRDNSFLVWPCGGRRGTTYFKISQRGWRLQDIYNVQMANVLTAAYGQNVYINGVNTRLELSESV